MKDETIRKYKSSTTIYLIRRNLIHGFYIQMRHNNFFMYILELWSDYKGETSIHPQWYCNRFFSTLRIAENMCMIKIRIDNEVS